MKFFRSKVVVWIIVSIMILGLVAAYMPLFFTSKPEPVPIPVKQPGTPPPLPLVLIPTSTTAKPSSR